MGSQPIAAGSGSRGEGLRAELLATGRTWFWPAEVAEICQVSRKTVYSWIKRGTVRPIPDSSPVRIPREEVEKLLN